MNPPITPDELHLLSAYLDGQLTPAEIRQAEELLASRFEMRTALDELSQTRALLRSLPMRRAPRNFTLSPAMAPKRRLNPLAGIMRWSSAFATAAAVVVLALGQLGGLLGGAGAPLSAAAPVVMESNSAAEAQAADSMEATAPVIVWGEPGEQVLGMGGGGAGGMGGGDGTVVVPVYPEATAAAAAAETGMMPQPTPTAVAEVPPAAVEEPAPAVEAPATDTQTGKMGVYTEPTAMAPVTPAPTVSLDESSPILGVPPESERGMEKAAPSERSAVERETQPAPSNAWSFYIAGALLALAIMTGVAGFLLGKR